MVMLQCFLLVAIQIGFGLSKLACQQRIKLRPAGVVIVNNRPSHSLKRADKAIEYFEPQPSFVRPDLCCGPLPFNSGVGFCCLGKVINTMNRRCCLDGNSVPRDTRCLCYPSSDWIKQEMRLLVEVEDEYRSSIDDYQTNLAVVMERNIEQRMANLERLDAMQEWLYGKILEELETAGISDNLEKIYILNQLTANINSEGEVWRATVGLETLERAAHVMEGISDGSDLERMRREMKILRSNIETAEQLSNTTRDELEPYFSMRQEVQQLVVKRQQIFRRIVYEERQVSIERNLLRLYKRIISVLRVEINLLQSLRVYLDELLIQVSEAEAAKREEQEEIMEKGRGKRGVDDEERSIDEQLHAEVIYPKQGRNIPPYFLLRPPPAFLDEYLEPTERIVLSSSNDFNINEENEKIHERSEINVAPSQLSTVTPRAIPQTKVFLPNSCNYSSWHKFISHFLERFEKLEAYRIISSDGKNTVRKKRNANHETTKGMETLGNWHDVRTYRDFTSYSWLADFQVYQFSDDFTSYVSELMKSRNIGIFDLL